MDGKINWLASYPKSGNTWLRSFLTCLLIGNKEFSLSSLLGDGIILNRIFIDSYLGMDSAELYTHEILNAMPSFLKYLSNKTDQEYFAKTHNAYLKNEKKAQIIPVECIKKVVYLVRNPFDVCVSLSNHIGKKTFDSTISYMNEEKPYNNEAIKFLPQLPQNLGSWSSNYLSWKENIPDDLILICRYEDLLDDPVGCFSRIADFLGMTANKELLLSAVERTSFKCLKSKELTDGFGEKPLKSSSFFFRGKTGSWKDVMTEEQVNRLKDSDKEVLQELKYIDDNENILV